MMSMASSKFQHIFIATITFNLFIIYASPDLSISHQLNGGGGGGRRGLKSFKEKAVGTNITFDCSPSGPCVPCGFSEKKDIKYRCSETGYRIPMKCVKTGSKPDEPNDKKKKNDRSTLENNDGRRQLQVLLYDAEELATSKRHRNILEDSSKKKTISETYVTYRSCIPAVNQEKLSVIGFEAIMLLLLMGSSFVIFKRKGTWVMPGAVRVPTNSRF